MKISRLVLCILLAFLILLVLAVSLFILNFSALTDSSDSVSSIDVPVSADVNNEALISLAYGVLHAMHQGDFEALSTYVHPSYGIIFTPYSTIDMSVNQQFSTDEVADFEKDDTLYLWGTVAGEEGQVIEMTAADYFSKFLFAKNYLAAPIISVDQMVYSGNAFENTTSIFPYGHFVDFSFPGTAQNQNTDWSTLRLVFEEYDGSYALTAVIHCAYTI